MSNQYPSLQAVPQEDVDALADAFRKAAEGDDAEALKIAVRELLFLMPNVSQGMMRLPPAQNE